MTYTPEDVKRLVKAAEYTIEKAMVAGLHLGTLKYALAPFQPDPEAELVERIALFIQTSPHMSHVARALSIAEQIKEAGWTPPKI